MKNILTIVEEDVKGNKPCIKPQIINDKNEIGDLLLTINSSEEMETYVTLFEEFIQAN